MLHQNIAAPAIDKSAIQCLFNNLNLILKNKELILNSKQYKQILIPGIFVGGLYIGMYQLSLGDILMLWNKTEWKTDNKYYFNIIGSPLSGINTAHYYNIQTKTIESESYYNGKLHWGGLGFPAINYIQHGNFESLKRNCRFYGEIKHREFSKLTIFDLIKQISSTSNKLGKHQNNR